jgi:hypothetical protein
MLVENRGVLSFYLGWAYTAFFWLCLFVAVRVIVRKIAVEPGSIEVVDNVAAYARIVVVGHGRDVGW